MVNAPHPTTGHEVSVVTAQQMLHETFGHHLEWLLVAA